MRSVLALAVILVTAACNSDDAEYIVRVNTGRDPLSEATVILELEDRDDDNIVCGTTDANGRARLVWDSCELAVFDCVSKPYAVRVSKTGFTPQRRLSGFSMSNDETFDLSACTDDCDDQETCEDK